MSTRIQVGMVGFGLRRAIRVLFRGSFVLWAARSRDVGQARKTLVDLRRSRRKVQEALMEN